MKKAWTPDHCPLQVGSVVYDPRENDVHDKVSDIITELASIFEEVKYDEQ